MKLRVNQAFLTLAAKKLKLKKKLDLREAISSGQEKTQFVPLETEQF